MFELFPLNGLSLKQVRHLKKHAHDFDNACKHNEGQVEMKHLGSHIEQRKSCPKI